ncbi:hypothetical protein [Paenibacillus ihumii]|uniref:hypothetical protein n=1 Tax=Paenibacillus ihumii TaxID=687436 RepID=UPI0006D7CCAC|nr:hypothetical protein [Paenibacillus ihumii]
MKKTLLILLFVSLLAGCGEVKNTEAKDSGTVKQTKTDKRSPELKFVEDDLDSLIRSTSSLVDQTWKTSVAESIDNYQFGLLSAESTISDLELAKQQYNSKITELEGFETPNDLELTASAKIFLDGTIENLSKAIQGRVEVIDYLIDSVNKGSLGQDTVKEIESRLIVPNTYLQQAANSYANLLENI